MTPHNSIEDRAARLRLLTAAGLGAALVFEFMALLLDYSVGLQVAFGMVSGWGALALVQSLAEPKRRAALSRTAAQQTALVRSLPRRLTRSRQWQVVRGTGKLVKVAWKELLTFTVFLASASIAAVASLESDGPSRLHAADNPDWVVVHDLDPTAIRLAGAPAHTERTQPEYAVSRIYNDLLVVSRRPTSTSANATELQSSRVALYRSKTAEWRAELEVLRGKFFPIREIPVQQQRTVTVSDTMLVKVIVRVDSAHRFVVETLFGDPARFRRYVSPAEFAKPEGFALRRVEFRVLNSSDSGLVNLQLDESTVVSGRLCAVTCPRVEVEVFGLRRKGFFESPDYGDDEPSVRTYGAGEEVRWSAPELRRGIRFLYVVPPVNWMRPVIDPLLPIYRLSDFWAWVLGLALGTLSLTGLTNAGIWLWKKFKRGSEVPTPP